MASDQRAAETRTRYELLVGVALDVLHEDRIVLELSTWSQLQEHVPELPARAPHAGTNATSCWGAVLAPLLDVLHARRSASFDLRRNLVSVPSRRILTLKDN